MKREDKRAARKVNQRRKKKTGRLTLLQRLEAFRNYWFSTPEGGKVGLAQRHYLAVVRAQAGFTTKQLEYLRFCWVKQLSPRSLTDTKYPFIPDVDWAMYLQQARRQIEAYVKVAGEQRWSMGAFNLNKDLRHSWHL